MREAAEEQLGGGLKSREEGVVLEEALTDSVGEFLSFFSLSPVNLGLPCNSTCQGSSEGQGDNWAMAILLP